MRVGNGQVKKPESSAFSDLKEGFDYLRRTRPVRALLLLIAFVSIFGLSYLVLMPIFADKVLGGGARSLGILMCAAGGGALTGALTLAARRQVRGLGRVIASSVAALGVMLILFSLSRSLVISTALLFPIGFTLMLHMSASNTLLQTMSRRLEGRIELLLSLMGRALSADAAGAGPPHRRASDCGSGGALWSRERCCFDWLSSSPRAVPIRRAGRYGGEPRSRESLNHEG